MLKTKIIAAAALMLLGAGSAQATTMAALTGERTLLLIDAGKARVTRTVHAAVGERIVGIDVRPADGKLYALLASGAVVILDPRTGQATPKVQLAQSLPAGVQATVDFNPVADRLRLIGSDGTSLRANVDDGTVAVDGAINYAQPNPFGAVTPKIVAGAYTNSFAGTKGTLLIDLDDASNAVYAQVPPNAGTLNALASQLDIHLGDAAFDIATDRQGRNTGWLLNNRTLFRLDLLAGVTRGGKRVQGLGTAVRDIAVLR